MKNVEILNEEIKRFRLLSGYVTKNTSSENIELLSEQGLRSFIRGLSRAGKNALSREIDNLLRGASGRRAITVFDNTGTQLTKSDDILKAIENGRLAPAELGKVNAGLFKTTTNKSLKIAIAEDIAASKTFASKYAIKTEKEARQMLLAKGYTLEESKMIIEAYKRGGNSFGKIPKPTGSKPPKPKTKTKKAAIVSAEAAGSGVKSMWKRFRNAIVGLTLGKTLLKLALLGLGIWAIYYWFLQEDESGISDCLKRMIPEDDWRAMVEQGLEYVLISETGEPTIDSYGGGKFWPGGKFESIDGQLKGTWEDNIDGDISVEVSSKVFTISCDGLLTGGESDDETQSGESEEIVFTPCQTFPFVIGCENEKIGQIKKCLKLTDTSNKFDETLKLTLVRNGYDETITEDIYNKIIQRCEDESLSDYERFGIEAMKNVSGVQLGSASTKDF